MFNYMLLNVCYDLFLAKNNIIQKIKNPFVAFLTFKRQF